MTTPASPESVSEPSVFDRPTDFGRGGLTPVSASPEVEPLLEIPGYELRSRIGSGSMGVVYEAWQHSLQRRVAIKVLTPELHRDPELVRRFELEGTILARMSHPRIVQVFERGQAQDRLYLVLEYVDGPEDRPCNLRERLASASFTIAERHLLALQIASALAHAHQQKIVHRDIKPSNVLLDRDSNVKVTDFGIAAVSDADSRLTVSGGPLGTLEYMAPEQRRNASAADFRSDIFSFGVLLYEMLTGHLPEGIFLLPSEELMGLSEQWDAIVSRALQPSPAERYQNFSEVIADLEAVGVESWSAQAAAPPTRDAISESSGQPAIQSQSDTVTHRCGVCNANFGIEDLYCPRCGTTIVQDCAACQRKNQCGTRFCGGCGRDLRSAMEAKGTVDRALQKLANIPSITDPSQGALTAQEAWTCWKRAQALLPDLPDLVREEQRVRSEVSRHLWEGARLSALQNRLGAAAGFCQQVLEAEPDHERAADILDRMAEKREHSLRNVQELLEFGRLSAASKLLSELRMQYPDDTIIHQQWDECAARRLKLKKFVKERVPELQRQGSVIELLGVIDQLQKEGTRIQGLDALEGAQRQKLQRAEAALSRAREHLGAGALSRSLLTIRQVRETITDHPDVNAFALKAESLNEQWTKLRLELQSSLEERRWFRALRYVRDVDRLGLGNSLSEKVRQRIGQEVDEVYRLSRWVILSLVSTVLIGVSAWLALPTSRLFADWIGTHFPVLSGIVPQDLVWTLSGGTFLLLSFAMLLVLGHVARRNPPFSREFFGKMTLAALAPLLVSGPVVLTLYIRDVGLPTASFEFRQEAIKALEYLGPLHSSLTLVLMASVPLGLFLGWRAARFSGELLDVLEIPTGRFAAITGVLAAAAVLLAIYVPAALPLFAATLFLAALCRGTGRWRTPALVMLLPLLSCAAVWLPLAGTDGDSYWTESVRFATSVGLTFLAAWVLERKTPILRGIGILAIASITAAAVPPPVTLAVTLWLALSAEFMAWYRNRGEARLHLRDRLFAAFTRSELT